MFSVKEAEGIQAEQGMQLAMTAYNQLGKGGTKNRSWYGFSNRVEWCAILVSLCAVQCGLVDACTGNIRKDILGYGMPNFAY